MSTIFSVLFLVSILSSIRAQVDQASSLQHHYHRLKDDQQHQPRFQDTIDLYWQGNTNWSSSESFQVILAIAGYYLNTGIVDSALLFYNLSLPMAASVADTYYRKGLVFKSLGIYEKAFLFYHKALDIYQKSEFAKGIITTQTALAFALLESGQKHTAEKVLEQTRALAENKTILPQLKDFYLALSQVKTALGKEKEAYLNYNRYHQLKDSIYNLGHLRVIAEMEANYHQARKERELAQLESDTAYQNNRIRRLTIFIYAMAAALILLVFSSIILYRTQAKNKIIAAQREELNQQRINELKQERELIALNGMVEGQISERKRMAAELYDGLGDLLSSTKMKLGSIGHSGLSVKDRLAYEKGNQLLDIAFQELRKISHNTMPGAITHFGILPALQDACRALQQAQNIQVDLQVINFAAEVSETLSINIYRIIQELLNNIVKHARASEVIVQLAKHGQHIQLTVEDNGIGFHPGSTEAQQGFGLKSIRSRVNYLEGNLEIHSIPESGTTFYITIPSGREVKTTI